MAVNAAHVKQVFVHPVALFAIVDSYERRSEDAKRVVGTLLGTISNNFVEIKNCFTVPHVETQVEVAFDKEYASSMRELYKCASPSEEVVGWFATSNEVTGHSTLIHEYYAIECDNPIHLTVDTQLKTGRMSVKAYTSSPIGVPGGTMGTIFTPIPCQYKFYETELVAVKTFAKNKGGSKKPLSLLNSVGHISKSADVLLERLKDVLGYVNDVLSLDWEIKASLNWEIKSQFHKKKDNRNLMVKMRPRMQLLVHTEVKGAVAGKSFVSVIKKNGLKPANNEIGQKLMTVVGSVPQMDPLQLEKMMNNNMQDLLMVLYLASLTKSQLAVATKLNSIL